MQARDSDGPGASRVYSAPSSEMHATLLITISPVPAFTFEQAFGILVARFGILWRPLRVDLCRVPRIISACMRLHNLCAARGDTLTTLALPPLEHENITRAYRRWWRLSQSIRTSTGQFRGRQRDEETSFIRDNLTQYLRENDVHRPQINLH